MSNYISNLTRPKWLTEEEELLIVRHYWTKGTDGSYKLDAVKNLLKLSQDKGNRQFGLKECKEYLDSFYIQQISEEDYKLLLELEETISSQDEDTVNTYLGEVNWKEFLTAMKLYKAKYTDKGAIQEAINQLQKLL